MADKSKVTNPKNKSKLKMADKSKSKLNDKPRFYD